VNGAQPRHRLGIGVSITLILGAAVVAIAVLTTWMTGAVSRSQGAMSLSPPFAPLTDARLAPRGVRFVSAFTALGCGALGAYAVNVNLDPAWRRVTVPLTLLGVLLFVLRAFRISLVLDDEGVEIKNYWRTSRFGWEDVVAIRAAPVFTHIPNPYAAGPRAVVFETRRSGTIRSQATEGMKGRKPLVLGLLRARAYRHGFEYKIWLRDENSVR
jgi:hypothetical protein